jgi:hypothetical protein
MSGLMEVGIVVKIGVVVVVENIGFVVGCCRYRSKARRAWYSAINPSI